MKVICFIQSNKLGNEPGKKVWIKLDRNVSIQFNTVFENYVSIQKSIKESKEAD